MVLLSSVSRFALSAILACGLVAGVVVVPKAVEGVAVLRPGAGEAEIVAYRLRGVPATAYQDAIVKALGDDDPDLAASLLALADSRDVITPPDLRQRVAAAQGFDAGRSLRDAWSGLAGGDARSPEALAGAVTADLTGISDARDLVHEGRAYINGEVYSPLTMGLAAAGLVITGATIASFGMASPARVGVTALKVADKADLLRPPFRRAMTSVATDLIDGKAVRETVDLASAGNLGAARLALSRSVRAKPLAALTTTATDLGALAKGAGYRATHDVLKLADSPADISRFRRLAESFGPRFRGALVLVGGAALTTAGLLATVSGWLLAGLMWVLAAVFAGYRILRWLWRLGRPRQSLSG
ncbi:hypothetical protein [Rhizobium tumorigenes]|uniref:Uncharacterized protein n=1 Tax=Rhizobium tumorigenes TaxID=2041385 RepID=A0AAF1KVN0_9HYPH|nr:hypothetical protein [Rhizobium tumorigenes]WFR94464.1 hypothetical protein PR017_11560 [Rhizobium tumorigenes]